jgi:hypothetical protein
MSDAVETEITRSITDIGKSDGIELAVQAKYIPPLDGNADDFAEADMRICQGIGVILSKVYFGYGWKTFADSKQGVVGFSIPSLMGETLHYVINLKQYSDLTPDLIVKHGGELLERMNLPRGKADQIALVEAQNRKHTFDFGKTC